MSSGLVVIGAGFGGLNAAKTLAGSHGVQLTVLDQRNHHLFQPLLYQVAMAGLSPADICMPIRSVLRVRGFQTESPRRRTPRRETGTLRPLGMRT